MTEAPDTPTDLALSRLPESELLQRRKEALEAFQEAKNKGEERDKLERIYNDLEAEHNRRVRNNLPQ